MFHPDRNAIFFRLVLIVVVLFSAAAAASAQTVVYDWSGNSKVPESYPRITSKETVTFNINKVNNILFTYRLEVTQSPMDDDDFKKIADLMKGFMSKGPTPPPGIAANQCVTQKDFENSLANARDSVAKDTMLPIGYATLEPKTSVSLDASTTAWAKHAKEAEALAGMTPCSMSQELKTEYDKYVEAVAKIQKKVDGSHVFSATSVISPGNNVSATVFEIFDTKTISSKTFTFPGTDVLTLSAGALFSSIPDQTYEARKTPASTLNVLTVEGNSRATPAVVALLNYSLGGIYKKLDGEATGLALSAGPVIRLGTQSDASSFGFFTGISGHLYHRFYLTPGIHFGQFSDFPVGFANGSPVPESFGELTPVKRWTARFGFAITFKTKDFSGLTSSDKPSVTGDEAGGSGKSKKTATNGGTKTGNQSNASEVVARSFLKPASEGVPLYVPSDGNNSAAIPQREASVRNDRARETPRDTVADSRSTVSSYFASTLDARVPLTYVTSLHSSTGPSGDERIAINSSGLISSYVTYFKGGRFFLVIPHGRLDVIEDGLRGRIFSEPVVEKRGDDLVLSFVFLPGTKARVLERVNGLELVLMQSDVN